MFLLKTQKKMKDMYKATTLKNKEWSISNVFKII